MTRHTVKQLTPAIGATVQVAFESLTIPCIVTDAKNSYGNVRVLIKPVSGSGEQWIELSRLREPKSKPEPVSIFGRSGPESGFSHYPDTLKIR